LTKVKPKPSAEGFIICELIQQTPKASIDEQQYLLIECRNGRAFI